MSTPVKRRGIPFDEEDEKILDALKKKLQPKYGVLNVTAIIRMALRHFLESQKK